MKVVLASRSPRRKELLHHLFENFEIRVSSEEEDLSFDEPGSFVEKLAMKKAFGVERNPGELIIAADTIVFLDGMMLGKPESREDAEIMLKALSGREHFVYTGVCLLSDERRVSFHEKTKVCFREIEEEEYQWYLDEADYMDKAGAYAIQEHAIRFVEGIEGDYSNVVGFPVCRTYEELRKMNIDL